MVPAMVVAGLLGGGLWGLIPGALRAWFGASEIITSLMLNYVAILFSEYLVHGPWRDPQAFGFPGTPPLPDAAWLPNWGTTRVHLGLLFGLVAAVALWVMLRRTRWGYEIGVMGENPRAALYAGMPTKRTILLVMAVSGALAGLAGMSEVAGIGHQLQRNLSPGYGYAAIIVAWLGRLHPFGAVLVAFLLAALTVGGDQIQMSLGLPAAIAPMLQGHDPLLPPRRRRPDPVPADEGGGVMRRMRVLRLGLAASASGRSTASPLVATDAGDARRRPLHVTSISRLPTPDSRLVMPDFLTPAFVVSVLAAAVAAGTAILYRLSGRADHGARRRAEPRHRGDHADGGAVRRRRLHLERQRLGGRRRGDGRRRADGRHPRPAHGRSARQPGRLRAWRLTIFGAGLSAFLGRDIVGRPPPEAFRQIDVPLLADIPALGRILFQQDALVYVSLPLVAFLWWYIYRTRAGLRLRAIGERPEAADAMGIDVARLRAGYVIAGGALAGLGGAAISLGTNPGWTEGMTAGRGWIAVALVIFAGWNPLRAALGAYLFGGVEAGQFRLQTAGVDVSPFFLNMLPYLFTILVLVISTREATRRTMGAPAALGRPYMREDRG